MRPGRKSNPFYFGDLALDEAFTDRESELKSLKSDILNGLNVALIAPRRYGKSSLVRRAIQELMADGVLVAEVDLMKTPTKAKLASKLARAIHSELASTMFKAKDALRIFSSLRITPVITFNTEDSPTASASRPTTPRKTSTRRSNGSSSCRRSWRRSKGKRSRSTSTSFRRSRASTQLSRV